MNYAGLRLSYADRKPGAWDFDGSCAPFKGINGRWSVSLSTETFSLGCFQWVPTADGKHVKRGKVVARFKGRTADPQPTFDEADAWCRRQEEVSGE